MSDEMKSPEMKTAETVAPQTPIQIPIDFAKMEPIYCNFFRLSLSSSTEEVLMDIGLHTGILTSANSVEPIHLTHRVVLNPFVAKRLLQSLQQIIARHEQAFGALELDPQRRLRGGPRQG